MKSSTLKGCGEEKARGALHPKCRSERGRISPCLLCIFFSLCFFFFFFCLRKRRRHCLLLSCFCSLHTSHPFLPTSPSYLFMSYCCNKESDKLASPSSLCLRRRRRRGQLFSSGVTEQKAMTSYYHCLFLCV